MPSVFQLRFATSFFSLSVAGAILTTSPAMAEMGRWGKDVTPTCATCYSRSGVGSGKSLAVDRSGNTIAIFQQQNRNGGNSEIVAARYAAATMTWSMPHRLTVDTVSDIDIGVGLPEVGMDDNGNAFATWGYGDRLFWARYDVATSSWSWPKSILTNLEHQLTSGGDLAVDGKGNAFMTGFNRVIRYDVITDTWCPPVQIDEEEIGNVNRVAADRAGNAVVVWPGTGGMKTSRFRIATGR